MRVIHSGHKGEGRRAKRVMPRRHHHRGPVLDVEKGGRRRNLSDFFDGKNHGPRESFVAKFRLQAFKVIVIIVTQSETRFLT